MLLRQRWSETRLCRASGIVGLLCLTACPQKTAVWVETGSSARHVVFRISDRRGGTGSVSIGVVRVYECGGSSSGEGAMWVVGPRAGTANLQSITYGITPQGFASDQGPRPLTRGCYEVAVSGTGRTQFTVDANGAATEHAGTE